MTYKDIHIGDWFYIDNYLDNIQVNGIINHEAVYTEEMEYESEFIEIKLLQPILLTDDILIINSFMYNTDETKLFFLTETLEIIIRKQEGYYHINGFNCKTDTHITMNIRFVHELQHVLSLLGVFFDISVPRTKEIIDNIK